MPECESEAQQCNSIEGTSIKVESLPINIFCFEVCLTDNRRSWGSVICFLLAQQYIGYDRLLEVKSSFDLPHKIGLSSGARLSVHIDQ
jgi:hypothetical protein